MGYSNIALVEQIVAQALTSGSPDNLGQPVDLLKIGNVFTTNIISEDTVETYIRWADSQIDSTLNELYVTPFCELANFETFLLSSIDDYNDYIITTNSCPFYPGDNLILSDGDGEVDERHIVDTIINDIDKNIFTTLTPIINDFEGKTTRVIRVSYPDPLPLTSARLAAANIYEKYFMSQSSPNESDYGQMLRKLARADLNNVLNGRTIMHGQHRIGRRFFNSNTVDRYGLPSGQPTDANVDEV